MKKLLLILVLVALFAGGCGKPPEKETLVMVFTPGPSSDLATIEAMYGPMIESLEVRANIDVEIVLATNSAAVIEALRNGTADMARLGAFAYVMAREEVGVIPLVREISYGGRDHYLGYIIGQPGVWEEPFTMEQLKGKTMVFSDPASTSGYLIPVTMLREAGMTLGDLSEHAFTGNHPASIEAVVNKAVDAAAVPDTRVIRAVDAGIAVEGENFVILAVSPKIMLPPWVVRPDLDPGLRALIRQTLLTTPEGVYLANPDEFEGFVHARDSDYDFTRAMAEAEEALSK